MKPDLFGRMVETIYGTFGSNPPGEGVKTVLWDRVGHIPDIAVGFIVKRIKELDSLPRNLGKSILAGWYEWRSAHPETIGPCKSCGDSGLDVWRQGEDGKWKKSLALCANCYEGEKQPPSRHEIIASGGVIMPRGYPGGPLGFDRDKGYFALTRPDTPRYSDMRAEYLAAIGKGQNREQEKQEVAA